MSSPNELLVLLGPAVAGVLIREPATPVYRLEYTDTWLGDPYAFPVSLALPLAAARYEGLPVRNWLRGLLPENEAKLREVESRFGISRDDPFAVLAHIGEDCVGAVRFATAERAEELRTGQSEGSAEWLDEAKLEQLLRTVADQSSPDREAITTGRFSLPGALGKIALTWDAERRRWGLPSGQRASTHILKPPLRGVVHHNENEHFCLRLAEAAGLTAAASRVERFGSENALVVTRYDREVSPDGRVFVGWRSMPPPSPTG